MDFTIFLDKCPAYMLPFNIQTKYKSFMYNHFNLRWKYAMEWGEMPQRIGHCEALWFNINTRDKSGL